MDHRAGSHVTDRAGRQYWERFWNRQRFSNGFGRVSYFRYSATRLLLEYVVPGARVCEVGCGASVWLPALAEAGADCWGIDYSEEGLARTRQYLTARHQKATLVLADITDPAALPPNAFDVVFSLGFIEHFAPVDSILGRIAQLLKPGGVLITLIPNLAGLWGRLQYLADPTIHATHVVYTPERLDEVHVSAGLDPVMRSGYFGGFGPLVVNFATTTARLPVVLSVPLTGTLWVGQQFAAWGTSPLSMPKAWARLSSHLACVYRNPMSRGHVETGDVPAEQRR